MLAQSDDTIFVQEESFEPFDAQAVALRERRKSLKGFYPTVMEIDVLSDEAIQYTMDRTLHYMLHLDQTFSTNRTFDYDHFVEMKKQGQIYHDWLETDDTVPYPAELKYSSPVVDILSTDDSVEYTVINNELVPVTLQKDEPKSIKKPRSPSTRSAYHQAKAIYVEDVAAGKPRAFTLARFENELGMKANTANVYYSKLKHA